MLNVDYINSDYKTEKRDSFLLALLLHILLLVICLLPLLDLNIQPKEPIKGIMVVFNQDISEEKEIEPIPPAQAKSHSAAAKSEKKTTTDKKPTKATSKAPEQSKAVINKNPAVDIETESSTKEYIVIIDEAKLKAEEEAKQATIAAEKLKNQKDKFGSLFGDSNSTQASNSTDSKPSTSTLEGNSSEAGTSATATGGLGSRGIVFKPRIEDNSNKEGRVIVKICVNQNGNVTSSDFVQSGSTTTDTQLIQKAIEGAKKYKFSIFENQEKQCGNITIDFILK